MREQRGMGDDFWRRLELAREAADVIVPDVSVSALQALARDRAGGESDGVANSDRAGR
jgi:hypothetical protein